uniref:Carboxypeptidase n=1 Tax=Chenopodium quinoa TaxID=63459 RepID=A0A803M1E1_CHEQI
MSSNCHVVTIATLIIHVILRFALIVIAAPQSSLVTYLPGFSGSFPSKHYSGNPAKDPVVLWLNGGPGCSSLGGLVYEHGPFNFEASGPISSEDLPKLHPNPYSWSKVSNIIYLDSPVGTGFSFSRNTSDYITGDLKTAKNTHIFLLKWFEMFPERLNNPFFIAGESYAGIFIPTLALEIMKGLDLGSRPIINIKGYMIGNGVADKYFDGNAAVPFAHGMGLISDDLYQEIVDVCHGSYLTPSSKTCQSKLDKFDDVTENVNHYNILEQCYDFYYDEGYQCYSCNNDKDLDYANMKSSRSFGKFGHNERRLPVQRTFSDHKISSLWSQVISNVSTLCHESETGRWDSCTDRLTYHRDVGSMIEYHKRLISMGLRVLIYSGDHDMVVPYTGNEAWTRSLGYKIIDEWRPWFTNGQVAGFTQGYDKNLTFLTIKDAGHMVPEDKPREALEFYSQWLAGKKI